MIVSVLSPSPIVAFARAPANVKKELFRKRYGEASKIARSRFVKEIKEREKLDRPIRSKAKEYVEKWLRKFSDEIQDTEQKRTISHFRSIIHGVNIQQVLTELRDLERNKIKGERLLTAVKELISKYNLEEKYKRKKEWRESIKEPPHVLCGMYLKGLRRQQTTRAHARAKISLAKLASKESSLIEADVAEGKFCEDIGRTCFLTQVEAEVRDWLFKLQDEKRLDIALKAFKAIDQQMKIGADVREVVGQVLREIRGDFGQVKENMDKSVKDYLQSMVEQARKHREETEEFVKQTVESQVTHVIEKVDLLLGQGKNIEEIQKLLALTKPKKPRPKD